jgi:hypothetical protein
MQRIAAPMVGGMITAPLLSMFVIPAAYLLMRRQRERGAWRPAFWRRKSPVDGTVPVAPALERGGGPEPD